MNLWIFLLVIFVGFISIFFPKLIWELKYGWKYENAKPTNIAIAVIRITGIFAILLIFRIANAYVDF